MLIDVDSADLAFGVPAEMLEALVAELKAAASEEEPEEEDLPRPRAPPFGELTPPRSTSLAPECRAETARGPAHWALSWIR